MSTFSNLESQMPPLYHAYKNLVTPSEVPQEFHLFVFMTMISALVGDHLYFREGNDTVYPNLWTMLVGHSGIDCKSTAIRPALKILSKIDRVHLLPPKGSPEGFFASLVESKGVGLLHHVELGSILGALRKDYMGGFVEDLCETYDPCSTSLLRRLSHTSTEIDHLAISWITATTPDSLNKCEASERIGTGFLPRWNIIFGTSTTTPIAFRPAAHCTYFDDFVAELKHLLSVIPHESHFDDAARTIHTDWYASHRKALEEGSFGYFGRRIFEVVKKYALLLALLRGHPLNIGKDDILLAHQFGEYFLLTADRLITREVTEDTNEAKLQKVLRVLTRLQRKNTPLTREHIYQYANLTSLNFKPIMDTLEARNSIEYNPETRQWIVFI